MIKLIPHQTVIEKTSAQVWSLSLIFELQGRHFRSHVVTQLDGKMIPLPTEIQTNESISVSPTTISASASYSNEAIDINKREVRFTITKPKVYGRIEHVKKEIKFKWSLLVPKKIRIVVKIGSVEYILDGLNHESSLIELISKNNNSSFYFPAELGVYEIPIKEIYKTCSDLYDRQAGAAWAVTWPKEESFWHSKNGYKFLISQYRKMIESKGLFQPRRIAVCPFYLDLTYDIARRYIVALEIQHLIGFDIRMVLPPTISDCFGQEDTSVTIYGSAVSILTKDIGDTEKNKVVYARLGKSDIDEGLKTYKEAFYNSKEWSYYKSTYNIVFNSKELAYISKAESILKFFAARPN